MKNSINYELKIGVAENAWKNKSFKYLFSYPNTNILLLPHEFHIITYQDILLLTIMSTGR